MRRRQAFTAASRSGRDARIHCVKVSIGAAWAHALAAPVTAIEITARNVLRYITR